MPERLGSSPSGGEAESSPLSAQEERRLLRAAAIRPLNVLVVVVGAFATFLVAWWMAPLTLLTYAALVLLAARDPIFRQRILPRRGTPGIPPGPSVNQDVSPERRARWLPRGETREKVESALVVYRKVVAAIEESDEVTRAVLEDTIPKLHAAANRLVDVAQSREQASEIVEDHRRAAGESPEASPRTEDIHKLEARIGAADAEISETCDKLLDLRARVVRVSLESGDPAKAAAFGASLDELNARLEALSDTVSPRPQGSSTNSLGDGT